MARDTKPSRTLERYMRLASVAYNEGNHKQAYDYWRRAAVKDPHNEAVWFEMLRVLEREEDRRVALENILRINPHNKVAQDLLNTLTGEKPESDSEDVDTNKLNVVSRVPRYQKLYQARRTFDPDFSRVTCGVILTVVLVLVVGAILYLSLNDLIQSICLYC